MVKVKAMIVVLVALALPACDDNCLVFVDADVAAVPVDAPVDATVDACVCDPSWPACPPGCLPPVDAGVDAGAP